MKMAIGSYSLKVAALLSTSGLLSLAAAVLNSYAPSLSQRFAAASSHVPVVYDNVVFFLRPPYLYLVINCIIISIVASSKLQHKPEDDSPPSPDVSECVYGGYVETVENPKEERKESDEVIKTDGGDEQRNDSMELPVSKNDEEEKPLVSSRFAKRKTIKAIPEGGTAEALRVTKGKQGQEESLESTWRKITESRPMPLMRHLKKSDTWQQRNSEKSSGSTGGAEYKKRRMTKSETFNDVEKPPSTPVRREPSLSQEELNRRVEAFINKFNEEMRLQRQESLVKRKLMMR